jgi:multidrug efflux pump subunit AcrA (membrane-fusion protein)
MRKNIAFVLGLATLFIAAASTASAAAAPKMISVTESDAKIAQARADEERHLAETNAAAEKKLSDTKTAAAADLSKATAALAALQLKAAQDEAAAKAALAALQLKTAQDDGAAKDKELKSAKERIAELEKQVPTETAGKVKFCFICFSGRVRSGPPTSTKKK